MLAEKTVNIIKELCRFIGGDDCSQWHVGITAQTEQRLLQELNIAADPRSFIYREAATQIEARAIANAFWNIECKKCPQAVDLRDGSAVYVFAYRLRPILAAAGVENQVRSQSAPINASLG